MRVLLVLLTTSALACLVVYVYLAHSANSQLLYSTVDRRLVTWPRRIFLTLSATAGITCLYQGASTLLFWAPESVASVGDSGFGLRSQIAGAFALYCGIFFLIFVDRATHNSFFLRQANAERRELRRLLDASASPRRLEELRAEFEAEVNRLEKRLDADESFGRSAGRSALPDGQLISVYRELRALVDKRLKELPGDA
jgi:hypothetical protein